jgi:Iron-sulfur cluster binding domain of dihydroorotate dehydrogenase B
MGHYRGRVTEIRFDLNKHLEALIACTNRAVPDAGQYLLASDPDDPSASLGSSVFLAGRTTQGFWAVPSLPVAWKPGTTLHLVGPFGHGLKLPTNVLRLGLVGLGDTLARLMPVIHQFAASQGSMTLFSDLPLPEAPAALEAYPLASLIDALDWPDFMVFDLPLERLSELRDILKLAGSRGLPCPAQALVTSPMPCAGMAQCGACALPARRGWKLVCEDGPVFDLKSLKW